MSPTNGGQEIDCILIDDDILVHLTWKLAAKNAKKNILVFGNPFDFIHAMGQFDRLIPIYIDSDLGNNVLGHELAKEIHAKGFHEIYLATGYPADQFGVMPWIKAVLGKDPPW